MNCFPRISVLGLIGRKKDPQIQKFPSRWKKKYIYVWLIIVLGSGWYGRDPRNRIICTCWFVVTAVITGTWLLGLHARKSTSIHNYPGWRAWHVMNVGKIWLRKSQRRSGMISYRGCLAWSWILHNGESSGVSWSIGAVWTEASSERRVTSVMDIAGSKRMQSESRVSLA